MRKLSGKRTGSGRNSVKCNTHAEGATRSSSGESLRFETEAQNNSGSVPFLFAFSDNIYINGREIDRSRCRIEKEEDDSGKQDSDEYKIEYRNIVTDQLIGPEIRHSP